MIVAKRDFKAYGHIWIKGQEVTGLANEKIGYLLKIGHVANVEPVTEPAKVEHTIETKSGSKKQNKKTE
jgi:hypothetical protein